MNIHPFEEFEEKKEKGKDGKRAKRRWSVPCHFHRQSLVSFDLFERLRKGINK